jgi:hypothetical protein
MADANSFNTPFERIPATPVAKLPGTLPNVQIADNIDAAEVAVAFISKLPTLVASDLTESALWRDSLALTGTFRTFYTGESVLRAWKTTGDRHLPTDFTFKPETAKIVRIGTVSSWVDAVFTFKTNGIEPRHTASGSVSLIPDGSGGWKLWMLCTMLEQLDGAGNVDFLLPSPSRKQNGSMSNGDSYQPSHGTIGDTFDEMKHFDCIVVGGGQAGLGVGGRLQALNISYLIVDKNPEVGDSWNSRYDSTKRTYLVFQT